MFTLKIECSENIKNITIDFKEDSVDFGSSSSAVVSMEPAKSSNNMFDRFDKSNNDDSDDEKRSLKSISQSSDPAIIPDVKNRPPRVDNGFNEDL